MSYACVVNLWLLCLLINFSGSLCNSNIDDHVQSLQDHLSNDFQDDIPQTKRSVSSCRGHPNIIQCIRAYFSNRFRLRHRAVQDPVELRNIGKRNQVATSYPDRSEDQQESRIQNLHDVYEDLLKATSSDFQGTDDKRAAVDFRSIGRRSFAADFRNIGKRYLGADFRNIGKRMNAAEFRQIGKRGYAVDFRNIGKRLGVDFRNIGKRTVLKPDNLYQLSLLCSDTNSMVQCADRIASNTYI